MLKIRVLLADDHTLLRQGMKRLLEAEDDMEIVGEAGEGLEAIHKAEQFRPDVAVLDYAMPGLTGPQAAVRIKQIEPKTKIIVLTMHDDEEYVEEALGAGASGYILKDAAANELIAAIRAVYRGETYLSPRVSKKIVSGYLQRTQRPEPKPPYEQLTVREREILRLLAEGHSAKEVSRLLNIQPKTVDAHRSNLMKKLGLHSRTDLIKYAIRRKIIKV
ncbi:MAG: response regulator transcription factor [Nitrospirae bacterium]|nr:response regulator transcription factor [Candidatus Manganitrophaceae bacterium]